MDRLEPAYLEYEILGGGSSHVNLGTPPTGSDYTLEKMASNVTDEDACFFKCSNTNSQLITSGPKRIDNIIHCTKRRGDGLDIELTGTQSIKCHTCCVSSYTSEQHLKRFLSSKHTSDIEESAPKKTRRSESTSFCFHENCLFCGERCIPLAPDSRNPICWRKVTLCRTVSDLKQKILQVCDSRGDPLADSVRIRVNGALQIYMQQMDGIIEIVVSHS